MSHQFKVGDKILPTYKEKFRYVGTLISYDDNTQKFTISWSDIDYMHEWTQFDIERRGFRILTPLEQLL